MRKKIFRLNNYRFKQNMIGAAIAVFTIFGTASWFYFRSTIQKNISYRLENKLDQIVYTINDELRDYVNALHYAHAYFKTEGFLDAGKLRRFTRNVEAGRPNRSFRSVEYVSARHIQRIKSHDVLQGKIDNQAVLAAVNSGQIIITEIRPSLNKNNPESQQIMALLLPYYGTNTPPATGAERLKEIKGFLYIPVQMSDFFTKALGKPLFEDEKVNFKLETQSADSKFNSLIYKRFNVVNTQRYRELSKITDVYGQRWKFTVTTLPAFFTFTDRHLANILAVCFLIFVGLLIGISYQTQKLLNHETNARIIMNDSNKVKAAFLSNMSHEIRTPLNAINGFAEILSHTANSAERKYLIDNIRRSSYELTGFIDNILDISKIEFGRIYINKTNIGLLSVIEQIKDPMEMRAHAKGLSFEIESGGKLPTDIWVDKARVEQILINLIGNAIKFTEKGFVKLQVEAETAADRQAHLMFSVIDTGIGISAPDQLELFQSFSQIDYSNTRRYGGIGLGLALSRRLAQQFEGDVTLLQSQIGQGSVFRLRVPCGELHNVEWRENLFDHLPKPAIQLNFIDEIDLNKKKVLIVEDSEDNQEIFRYFLKSAGATADIAENGEVAVEKVRRTDYDFILMDIQLPKMDGLEATGIIRTMGYQKPIIALTAHASAEAKINCLKAGCTDLITKPVTQETLIQNILTILLKESKNDITYYNT